MKKLIYAIFAIAALVLISCSNKVNLYNNDEGDHTIVYATLDANADTNFFKITKSFVGNVNELGHNYAANNYEYNEIDVSFSGIFAGSNTPQTVALDTISKWIPYDENSVFYSGCYQRYYYTTKKLLEGKEYTINIFRKTDSVQVSAKTTTISNFRISKPTQLKLDFSEITTTTSPLEWQDPNYQESTAAYFEISAYLHYKELMPGATDTSYRSIKWAIASGEAHTFFTIDNNRKLYRVRYAPATLYPLIASDVYLENNSPAGVRRWVKNFEFRVDAVGEELYNYHLVTNSTSAIQDVPNFSNVENGKGLVSSRVTKNNFYLVGQMTKSKIAEKFGISGPNAYGFIYDPND